ncbi:serine hydrolase domain-containing protein [Caulobacter sp. BK020]|uniref:serine hydrolase domain-containing protein n=1 Tax=Caulobacter sp. BK020 TaxID=2512117 RepID=UPI001045D5BE|nr:serine hydrolase domain-containing protein [Caulobacter sp. BK020]TCS16060.1 CubicO group peptidase (beta-lactamase class C family) [Caulobacter sp. BK020]
MLRKFASIAVSAACLAAASPALSAGHADYKALDAEAARLMAVGKIPGLAYAVIEDGKVVHVSAQGWRNVEKKLPLTPDTIMYGASITKAAFGQYVLMLVDDGKLNLDTPIKTYLPKPLPDYGAYKDLAGDPRWETITPRMLMTHTAGFPNFRWLNPDEKLDIKAEPGTRFIYSGEGVNLMQFVIEQGLGLKVGDEMNRRIFQPLGMTRSSLIWRDDFAANLADGYHDDGKFEEHDARSSVKAAGSLDTTISDLSKLAAAMVSGRGLSARSAAERTKPSFPIANAHQFPPSLTDDNPGNARIGLAAGIGVVVFDGPQGHGFFKGGHNDITDNQLICVERGERCLVMLTNSGVGARIFPPLLKAALGDVGMPWTWEYNPVRPVAAP